ncbi:MAG: HlyD family efflux transporter periplasmic adaptor subunit [Woeseiaceae bacterium]|nr:HlyD family efflux transporter periplasmic adaptor subunit [Woeseiaceae bacterium]
MSDLFRKEVVERQSQRHMGDVLLSSPLSFWAITGLIAIIVAGLVLAAIFGEYARKERVLGVVVPSEGLVQIIPSQPGVFEEIYVETGDVVERGTQLLKIKNDTALADGDSIFEALLAEMETEKASLVSQLEAIPVQFELTESRLRNQQTDVLAEAQRVQDQIRFQGRAVELENDLLQRIQELSSDGMVSELEVTTQESNYLAAKQALKDLDSNYLNYLAQSRDIEAQIEMLSLDQAAQENEIRNRISAIEQNMIRAGSQSSLVLRSPVDGYVTTMTARQGQATTARPVMSILPEGGELLVELYVPARAAGFVKAGQSVRLLYDAFPYQKFGFFDGKVEYVSRTVINTADIANAPQLSEPVFLVTVTLEQQVIESMGETFPLQAGMSLSADLVLEDRKLWEWAFDPLIGAMRR